MSWSSNSPAVATVSAQGLVTAVGNGNASITARSGNTAQNATISVHDTSGNREALVVIYHSTDGPNWTNRTNWLTGKPLGIWHGVQTNTRGEVHSLNLIENNLQGNIPPEIGQLQNLQTLNLDNNDVTGSVLPEFGQLLNLTKLDLSANQLDSDIPVEIGLLQNLEDLAISHNRLTGPLPPGFGELGKLTSLRVSFSGRRGCPPSSLRHVGFGYELQHAVDIPSQVTPLPTEIDEGDRSSSANARIPGPVIAPGLEMVIEIDPDGALDPALGIIDRLPPEGRIAVDI